MRVGLEKFIMIITNFFSFSPYKMKIIQVKVNQLSSSIRRK